jgi:hypothetical protein
MNLLSVKFCVYRIMWLNSKLSYGIKCNKHYAKNVRAERFAIGGEKKVDSGSQTPSQNLVMPTTTLLGCFVLVQVVVRRNFVLQTTDHPQLKWFCYTQRKNHIRFSGVIGW